MDNRRLSIRQVLLIAVGVGLTWGLIVAASGVIYLIKSGNQPGDLQVMLKVAAVEAFFAMGGAIFLCWLYFWRRN